MKKTTANTTLVSEKRKMSIKEFVAACNGITPKSNAEKSIINFARIALKTQLAIRKFLNSTGTVKTFNLLDGFYYTIEKINGVYGFGSAGFDTVFKSKKALIEWIEEDLKELLFSTINVNYREAI